MSTPSEARATVTVREVGPRDGRQIAKAVMPTAAKLRWIAAMVEAGVREMEVASFVPPAAMPQMADAADVTRAVRGAHPELRRGVLKPGEVAWRPNGASGGAPPDDDRRRPERRRAGRGRRGTAWRGAGPAVGLPRPGCDAGHYRAGEREVAVLVVRRGAELRARLDLCPHQYLPLTWRGPRGCSARTGSACAARTTAPSSPSRTAGRSPARAMAAA